MVGVAAICALTIALTIALHRRAWHPALALADLDDLPPPPRGQGLSRGHARNGRDRCRRFASRARLGRRSLQTASANSRWRCCCVPSRRSSPATASWRRKPSPACCNIPIRACWGCAACIWKPAGAATKWPPTPFRRTGARDGGAAVAGQAMLEHHAMGDTLGRRAGRRRVQHRPQGHRQGDRQPPARRPQDRHRHGHGRARARRGPAAGPRGDQAGARSGARLCARRPPARPQGRHPARRPGAGSRLAADAAPRPRPRLSRPAARRFGDRPADPRRDPDARHLRPSPKAA